jgi:hypothetical protein
MSYKKLLQEHSPKDLAESFVFPVKLSAKQQKAADLQLAEAREKARENMTDAEKLTSRLMGLKFRMEGYYRVEKPNSEYSFGYFLKLYIELLDMKRWGFAEQIGIDETLLRQLINQRRTPPEYIPIRLELHSNNSIPAEYWFRVIEKDREGAMLLNKAAMREKEMKYVTGGISVRL